MYQHRSIKLDLANQKISKHTDGSISIYVPISFKRAGGRNFIMTPTETAQPYDPPNENEPLVNALVKAFTWKDQLDRGVVSSIRDLAKKQKISESYVHRIYRLTFLAPDIIEAILDGRQPRTLTLTDFLKPFPIEWEAQRISFGFKAAEV
jgi:hypothetical protein